MAALPTVAIGEPEYNSPSSKYLPEITPEKGAVIRVFSERYSTFLHSQFFGDFLSPTTITLKIYV